MTNKIDSWTIYFHHCWDGHGRR